MQESGHSLPRRSKWSITRVHHLMHHAHLGNSWQQTGERSRRVFCVLERNWAVRLSGFIATKVKFEIQFFIQREIYLNYIRCVAFVDRFTQHRYKADQGKRDSYLVDAVFSFGDFSVLSSICFISLSTFI